MSRELVPAAPRFHLEPTDRVRIGEIAYVPVSTSEDGHVLRRVDGDLVESFTHDAFLSLSCRPDFRFDRRFFGHGAVAASLRAAVQQLSDLPPEERAEVLKKLDYIHTFMRLEGEGRVNRSSRNHDATADAVHEEVHRIVRDRDRIRYEATAALKDDGTVRKKPSHVPNTPEPNKFSGARLIAMVALYERHGCDPRVLVRRWHRCGNFGRRLSPDGLQFLRTWVRKFAAENKPTRTSIYKSYKLAMPAENARLGLSGADALVPVSKETFFAEIRKMPAFAVYAGRHGPAAATRHFSAVTGGMDVARPLECVEMDEWCAQLMVLLIAAGIWETLNRKQRRAVERVRLWVYVAICKATRCIVGLRFAHKPNGEEAKATLAMIGIDKTAIARAAGAVTSWEQCGSHDLVSADAGASYVAEAFRIANADLGATAFNGPSATPGIRGTTERVNGTLDQQVLVDASGRTFGDVREKGDYDAQVRASLTVDDFIRILVIWVVDIYHNSPHSGLGGETPRNAWNRLEKRYGVVPPPDAHKRRAIFGLQVARVIGPRGVRFLGLHYQSSELQAHYRHVGDKVRIKVRVDRFDLGRVAVKIGGEWLEAVCTRPGFDGVPIATWMEAAAELRRRYRTEAELTAPVVAEAMRRIAAINGDAQVLAQIGPTTVTAEQVEAAERKTMLGFHLPDDRPADEDILHGEIPVTGPAVATVRPPDGDRAAPASTRRKPPADLPREPADTTATAAPKSRIKLRK